VSDQLAKVEALKGELSFKEAYYSGKEQRIKDALLVLEDKISRYTTGITQDVLEECMETVWDEMSR
jgi:hypothetical protein